MTLKQFAYVVILKFPRFTRMEYRMTCIVQPPLSCKPEVWTSTATLSMQMLKQNRVKSKEQSFYFKKLLLYPIYHK